MNTQTNRPPLGDFVIADRVGCTLCSRTRRSRGSPTPGNTTTWSWPSASSTSASSSSRTTRTWTSQASGKSSRNMTRYSCFSYLLFSMILLLNSLLKFVQEIFTHLRVNVLILISFCTGRLVSISYVTFWSNGNFSAALSSIDEIQYVTHNYEKFFPK